MTDLARNLAATSFRYDPVDTGRPSLPLVLGFRIFDGLPLHVGRCVGTTAFQRHDVIDHSARSAIRKRGQDEACGAAWPALLQAYNEYNETEPRRRRWMATWRGAARRVSLP